MTNVESKFAGFSTALLGNREEAVKDGIACLLSTERNYVLRKGQTTVDLEKAKLDKDALSTISYKMLDLLKKGP